jgi:hypothetical protein
MLVIGNAYVYNYLQLQPGGDARRSIDQNVPIDDGGFLRLDGSA